VARIVLDPDEVNQRAVVTLTDGSTVDLGEADAPTLHRIARQLHVHRSSYAHAWSAPDPTTGARVAAGEVSLEEVAPLYLAVAARLVATKPTGRGADQVDLGALLQDRVWTSSAGVTTSIADLTPSHRTNLMGWLERNSAALRQRFDDLGVPVATRSVIAEADPWIAGTPLYRGLMALQAQESALERAKDQARQVVRRVEFERTGKWPDR